MHVGHHTTLRITGQEMRHFVLWRSHDHYLASNGLQFNETPYLAATDKRSGNSLNIVFDMRRSESLPTAIGIN